LEDRPELRATIEHRMLITGELFRWPEKKDDATA